MLKGPSRCNIREMGDDAFVWGDFDCLDRQADPVVDGPSEPAASVECFAWPSEPAAAAAPVECFAWPSEPAASVECFAWPSEPATAADAGVADEAPAPDAPDAPEAHAVRSGNPASSVSSGRVEAEGCGSWEYNEGVGGQYTCAGCGARPLRSAFLIEATDLEGRNRSKLHLSPKNDTHHYTFLGCYRLIGIFLIVSASDWDTARGE